MRRALLIALLALSAAAACGDYSNEDIAFLEALPNSSALSIRVPTTPAGALTSDAKFHDYTVGTADVVNAWLTAILDAIDLVQTLPPAHRTADSRTWGPFDDHSHPGFEIQVTLTRSADGSYDFSCAERRRGSGAEFTPIITGTFVTPSAHLGHGTLHFDTGAQAGLGLDGGSPDLATIDVVYANDQSPRTVTTTVTGTNASNGTPATTTYDFQEQSDHSGKLIFDLATDFNGDLLVEHLHLVSVWLASGAGRADGDLYGGTISSLLSDAGSDRVSQCWDPHFAETYYDSELYTSIDGGPLAARGLGCTALEGHPGCPDGDAGACVLPAAWP